MFLRPETLRSGESDRKFNKFFRIIHTDVARLFGRYSVGGLDAVDGRHVGAGHYLIAYGDVGLRSRLVDAEADYVDGQAGDERGSHHAARRAGMVVGGQAEDDEP